ncbi:hypothetical protein BDW62DRAFT_203572 [Aspergillus aurantiobrunneus]
MTLSHDDYTVAWICALPLEMAAAKVMLDESHELLHQPATDHNTYTLGRRAGHNVVIACLPSGVYGTTSAATVLSHMLPTFPCLRFGLMVGIGGGIPREDVDIRLGDVVVSLPNASSGGVVQYDFGKALRDGRFQRTGSLNKPPQFLLTAISQIRSDYMIGKRPLAGILSETLGKHPELKEQFSRPNTDRLFESVYDHQGGPDCSECDKARLVKRLSRENKDPCLHYGLIASGNQVIKDATRRDFLAQEMDILCFEMEGAGLMDQLPCLVIRGICDYCDSHKNKQWQGYAALAAAAYAKTLLEIVPTLNERAESKRQANIKRHWLVPFHKNSRFVGREDEITRIEELINGPPSKIAICGLGGVGKTQIALEFAYRMRERMFDSIFWIPCTSYESFEQAYMSVAQLLGIRNVKATDAKNKVKAHLSQEQAGRWLLIFDNADNMDMWSRNTGSESIPLTEYLPQHEQGHILFTTRNRKLAVMLASSHVIHVSEPDSEAAVRILEELLVEKDLLKDSGVTVAFELLEQLAFLPLAITQAAAYINENGIDFSDYITLLQEQEADVIELLSEDFGDDWRYKDIQNPVATTWLISFQQIQQLDRLAADYLLFIACINPRDIPKTLLPEATSKKKAIDAIGLLKAFSFISEQTGNLSLHRLVHLSTRNWLRRQQQFHQQISTTAMRFEAVFPDHNHSNQKLWREYLPHVLALIGEGDFQEDQHLSLVRRVGKCLNADGRYNEAAPLFEGILRVRKELHGETNFKTLNAMTDLSWVYSDQGRLEAAEELDIQVFEVCKREFGPDHFHTLDSMSNLASTYSNLGKWEEAEEIREHVLEIDRRVHGPDDPNTLFSMHHLASTYRKLGELTKAEELEVQVLETYKRLRGAEHPDTLISMNNLARLYAELGKEEEAKELSEQMMATRKRILGPEHPDILTSMRNLSRTYQRLEQWEEAEAIQVELLETHKRVIGPEHPSTLNAMHDLANTWHHLGKTEEALALWETCMDLDNRVLGPDHPDTQHTMSHVRWVKEQISDGQ